MTGSTREIADRAEPESREGGAAAPTALHRSSDHAARGARVTAETQALILEVARAASHREMDAALIAICLLYTSPSPRDS